MRSARRWTEKDLEQLNLRAAGFKAAEPDPIEVYLAQERRKAEHAKLEALFVQHLTWSGMMDVFERQFEFHPERKWRFDFYARQYLLAVECHGGTYSSGHHVRGAGFENDRTKANAAAELGITVLEFTKAMLTDGTAIRQTERMLIARGWEKS